jgi:hypothetical protein
MHCTLAIHTNTVWFLRENLGVHYSTENDQRPKHSAKPFRLWLRWELVVMSQILGFTCGESAKW